MVEPGKGRDVFAVSDIRMSKPIAPRRPGTISTEWQYRTRKPRSSLILKEGGELVMAPASPAEFKPIATAKILPPVIRSYPAVANGKLYVRNEKTLVCLNLK